MLFVKIPRKKAEELRKYLIENNLYATDYKTFRDNENVYFPVLKRIAGYDMVEMEGEKFEKSKKLRELLSDVLDDEELENLVTSYDMIGDIAIIEIPGELESKEKEIADALLETNKRLKVVAKKLGKVESEFRVRPLEIIAGEKRTETIYTEHGCRMKIDVAKVYFSVRLSTERKRIAELVKSGENILALFAGVGPFPLVISKNHPDTNIIAIELNPEGVKYLEENIELNKMNNITAVEGDARKVIIEKYKNFADRILMPLPRSADKFLDAAIAGAKNGCIVHIYSFAPIEDPYKEIEKRIFEEAEKAGVNAEIINKKIVRPYAPKIVQVVIDFKVIK